MNCLVWAHFHALSAADALGTVRVFINLDTHLTFFVAETAFGAFAVVNLVTIQREAVK